MKRTLEPIFILGAPRSGTTYLASLLEKTPYGAPFETHFITKYFKRLKQYGSLQDMANLERLLKDILSERAVMQWGLSVSASDVEAALAGNVTYAGLVDYLCQSAADKKGYQSWGDKTPHYLGDLDILVELFPRSQFIFIVRDGRDVALSLLKKPWGPNNIYSCANYWVELHRSMSLVNRLVDTGNCFSLSYENLLDNHVAMVEQVYSFLGVDINSLESLPSPMKDNSGKWREAFSPRQLRIFNSLAADTLEYFGYEVGGEKSSISPWEKVLYTVHNKLHRLRHLFVINVIDTIKIKFFNKQPFSE
jgi:hypothetical protein